MKWRKVISHEKDIIRNPLKYYNFSYNVFFFVVIDQFFKFGFYLCV